MDICAKIKLSAPQAKKNNFQRDFLLKIDTKQGSSFPPMGGGEVRFGEKLPPHGGEAGGEVSPPMGERLGGKFSILPPHHGGEVGWGGGSFP